MTDPELRSADDDEPSQRGHRLEQIQQVGLYRQPLRDSNSVRALTVSELNGWSEEQRDLVAPYLLDVPHFHVREWDYAGLDTPARELYLPCWTVATFPRKAHSVVYCDHGHAGRWGALEEDGWCGPDASWNDSLEETIWRFRMLEGFAPDDKDLDDWIGPVRSLTREEFEHVQALTDAPLENPSILDHHLRRVWGDYTFRVEAKEWRAAEYLYEILREVVEKAPLETWEIWEERIRSWKPRLLKFDFSTAEPTE